MAAQAPLLDGEYGPPLAWAEFRHPNGRGRAVLTSFLMGASLLLAPTISFLIPTAQPFSVYLCLLVCFHMAEYLLTAAFRPDTLSFDNFLLNHSRAYQLMILLAVVEYWVELIALDSSLFPGCKRWGVVSILGLVSCFVGLGTRGLAMATASTNFSHKIEHSKRQEHVLVTHGIYSYLRHPAYFGFFWWSVGTQLLLMNPISLIAYTGATFYFFYDRIPYEEDLLTHFFGDQYREYKGRSFLGIPFLSWAIRALDRR